MAKVFRYRNDSPKWKFITGKAKRLLDEGKTTSEIAKELNLSIKKVTEIVNTLTGK